MSQQTQAVPALAIGAPIPPLQRTLTQVRLVAYGGATWDWHRLHYEPEYARARNIAGPIVDGQMFGALLAEALLDWLGPWPVYDVALLGLGFLYILILYLPFGVADRLRGRTAR